jgi:23S rRNA (pseudouridine1915-N3)-methyltransferase
MKLHIVTVGEPKLDYAKTGWELYTKRLGRYHALRTTHVADKHANSAAQLLDRAGDAYIVALVVGGEQWNSPGLAAFLGERAMQGQGQELCFMIGGPEGLPQAVIDRADKQWGLSELTLPHDLAMVVTAEALYRASTIAAGHPYHK